MNTAIDFTKECWISIKKDQIRCLLGRVTKRHATDFTTWSIDSIQNEILSHESNLLCLQPCYIFLDQIQIQGEQMTRHPRVILYELVKDAPVYTNLGESFLFLSDLDEAEAQAYNSLIASGRNQIEQTKRAQRVGLVTPTAEEKKRFVGQG